MRVGARLFSNLTLGGPREDPTIPVEARPSERPASLSIDGTFRPWGEEWAAREARLPPEEGQLEGAPVRTEQGETIRKLIGSHVFDHVHPSVGIAATADPRGLGLYAAADLAPGTLVCAFTGVWCYESEVDAQFPYENERFRACIHAYHMGHAYCFTAAEAERGRRTRAPNKGQPSLKGGKPPVRLQRLVCCPRMSVDSVGPTAFSLGLCNLLYSDAPGAPPCDVGAVLNHSVAPTCTYSPAVCTPEGGEPGGAAADAPPVEHAILLVRVGAQAVPMGRRADHRLRPPRAAAVRPEAHQRWLPIPIGGAPLQRGPADDHPMAHGAAVARRGRPGRGGARRDGAAPRARAAHVRAAGVVL